MADQIKVPIVSTYDSKGGDAALRQAKEIERAKPTLSIDTDTKAATRDIDGLMKKVALLDKDAATILLTSNATAVAGDITGLISDLDKLDADDPTVEVKATQINDLKADLDQIEAKLREVNSIPVDIDTRPAQKGVEDIGKSADAAKNVTANAIGNMSQDLSALGGVAGTAGTTIGQLGEYMADAAANGEGLGSIVANFAKFAGPVAALTIGMGLVTQVLGDIQKRNEEIAKNSKAIADGIAEDFAKIEQAADFGGTEGADFASALTENFVKTQETAGRTLLALDALGIGVDDLGQKLIALDSGDAGRLQTLNDIIRTSGRFKGATEDLADALALAVLTSEDYNSILLSMKATQGEAGAAFVEDNKAMVEALEQLDDAGEDLSVDQVLKDLKDQLLDSKGGVEAYAAALKELGPAAREIDVVSLAMQKLGEQKAAQDAADHVQALNDAYAEAARNSTAFADAQAEGEATLERVNGLLRDQADALNAQVDAAGTAADAQLAENRALADYAATLDDSTSSVDDQIDAALRLADAHVATADAQAKANGQTLTAVQKLDLQNDGLLKVAAGLKGPARQAVLGYIADLNQIPEDRRTEFIANANPNDLATTASQLNNVSATRTAAIQADANTAAAESELNNTARNRSATVTANVTVNGITSIGNGRYRLGNSGIILSRHGGMAGPEGRIAAEAGPEFIRLPTGERMLLTGESWVPPGTQITSQSETAAILSAIERSADPLRGGGPQTHVTVNVPRGYHGNVLEDARKAARRSGGLYRRNRR